MNKKLLYIIGAALAWIAYRAYTAYRGLKYRFSNIRFVSASGTAVTLGVDFELFNPTAITLKVGRLSAGLWLQGEKVGTVVYDCDTVLMANAVGVFPLQVTIDTAQVFNTAWNALAVTTIQQWVLTFSGRLEIAGHELPVRFEYPLKDLKL